MKFFTLIGLFCAGFFLIFSARNLQLRAIDMIKKALNNFNGSTILVITSLTLNLGFILY